MLAPVFLMLLLCKVGLTNKFETSPVRNSSEIVFSGFMSKSNEVFNNFIVKKLELAKKISAAETDEEFFSFFKELPLEPVKTFQFLDEFGIVQRSDAKKVHPALCMPESQVIPVKENPDPTEIYFPSCVRIKRCGGCCNHELLSCQPDHTEINNYQISVMKLNKATGKIMKLKEVIPLEEHIRCQCDCKIKEKDCTDKQLYKKKECRCVCKNLDEEEKCYRYNDKKFWDPKSCSCYCRNAMECSTGFYFDHNLCSCRNLLISRWMVDERNGYESKQLEKSIDSSPVVVTLDTDNSKRKHKEDPENK